MTFCEGQAGLITFAPDGITVKGGGALTYTVGIPNDTTVSYGDGALRFVHNHYAYTIPVSGSAEAIENGYRLPGDGESVTLDMSAR